MAARFVASAVDGNAPLLVAFGNLSSGEPTAQLWTFGDGDLSVDVHPVHVYRANGLYTVTLTVWSADGSDTRVKRDLIAVGNRAELLAQRQPPSVTDSPAWWVTLAVSPLAAGIWFLQDLQQGHRDDLRGLAQTGRTLSALVAARGSGTQTAALDLMIERYLQEAVVAHRRADSIQSDLIDRSTGAVEGLREALLLEGLLQTVDDSDAERGGVEGAIQDRLDELNATIDAIEGDAAD